ncbi:MAG TPA: beta-propeller fold lactonase family protein [Terriglobales bacterium]|nr:beta-propeller fold lactonase family protein [Terriglobales bacterium]
MQTVNRTMLLLVLAAGLLYSARSMAQSETSSEAGAVFVMNNSATRNEVISFTRAADGSLRRVGTFATGGRGTGGNTDPLESQGSLTLNQEHSLLFAVNGGSGDLSVFQVHGAKLALVDKKPTHGSEPNAVAQHGRFVYVLNVGGSSNVVGFALHAGGQLTPIPHSIRFLTTNNSEAASLAFSPDGQFLLVTERATNNIDAFRVRPDGTLSAVTINKDAQPGTFALAFAPNGAAVVSETGPAGGNNASTISSYSVLPDLTLSPISAGVPTLGNANCWNAVTPNGRFVYASNAGSSTISGFSIGATGALTPIDATVVGINPAGSVNLDIAVSADSKFLYSLNSGSGTIGIFAIQQDGTLLDAGELGALPANAGLNGITAF